MAHELAHWLTTPEGALARLEPDQTNTALPLSKASAGASFSLLPAARSTNVLAAAH